jgi:hypothetical protein
MLRCFPLPREPWAYEKSSRKRDYEIPQVGSAIDTRGACLALVLRLVRRSLGEVGSFSEGGCEADRVGNRGVEVGVADTRLY